MFERIVRVIGVFALAGGVACSGGGGESGGKTAEGSTSGTNAGGDTPPARSDTSSADGSSTGTTPSCSVTADSTYAFNIGLPDQGSNLACGRFAYVDTAKGDCECTSSVGDRCAVGIVCTCTGAVSSAKYTVQLVAEGRKVSGSATVVQSSSHGDVECSYSGVTGDVQ